MTASDSRFGSQGGVIAGGLASAISLVGAPIVTAITLLEGEHMSRRIELLVGEVARVAERVERKLDREFVASTAFDDAVIAALGGARRTSAEEKRRLLAEILVGAAMVDRPPDIEAGALLDALAPCRLARSCSWVPYANAGRGRSR